MKAVLTEARLTFNPDGFHKLTFTSETLMPGTTCLQLLEGGDTVKILVRQRSIRVSFDGRKITNTPDVSSPVIINPWHPCDLTYLAIKATDEQLTKEQQTVVRNRLIRRIKGLDI